MSPHARHRILLVEDDEDSALLMAETLQDLGHAIEVAHDGVCALEIAARFRPNMAVLDLGLPDMDGCELAVRLRKLDPPLEGLCLIALTGYGRDDDKRRSHEAGFDVHLVKPVLPQVLTRAVETGRELADAQGRRYTVASTSKDVAR